MRDDDITQSMGSTHETLPGVLIQLRGYQLDQIIHIFSITRWQRIVDCQQVTLGNRVIDLGYKFVNAEVLLGGLVGVCCRGLWQWLGGRGGCRRCISLQFLDSISSRCVKLLAEVSCLNTALGLQIIQFDRHSFATREFENCRVSPETDQSGLNRAVAMQVGPELPLRGFQPHQKQGCHGSPGADPCQGLKSS